MKRLNAQENARMVGAKDALLQLSDNISLTAAKNYLEKLDLTYILDKMCAEDYFLPRWIRSEAEQCCTLYKNYLFLCKKYPDEKLVPTRHVDEFWHNHILFTKNYTHDCLNIFGHYLHHYPETKAETTSTLTCNYLKTKELYLKEFGRDFTASLNPT